jgi:hypothetical protein
MTMALKLKFVVSYKDGHRVQLMAFHPEIPDPAFVKPADWPADRAVPLISDPAFVELLTHVTLQIPASSGTDLQLGQHLVADIGHAAEQPDYGGTPHGNHLTNFVVKDASGAHVVRHSTKEALEAAPAAQVKANRP